MIDAVFALGGEDDLVRLLARVEALQSFVEGEDGADLLTTYKRAANILKKEKWELTAASGGTDLEPEEAAEIHLLTTQAIDALRRVYGPDAFNVGWNLGQVAGGSIAAHLHEHVVPRWAGDTNFMPVLADVKVVPEHLVATRERLRAAWPVD